ncbi:BRISC and BRCA1-A complex member 2-like [Euwallacea similis]|uniref:BRISC and BRCA1-A complex member 2-like n=1 Tax=Euwallacea similis TaxID=1736056 RepID=UPI0034504BE8
MMNHNNDYSHHLHMNLRVLVGNGRIGLSKIESEDIQTKSTNRFEMNKGYTNNHLYINVPYAGKNLNWELIFHPEDISEPPDFDFNDYSFLSEPNIDFIAEKIPSWTSWDFSNSDSLYNILNEFLSLYKETQIQKLMTQTNCGNLREQYEQILLKLNISHDKVEIHVDSRNEFEQNEISDDVTSTRFLIELPIDFTQLPEYCLGDEGTLMNAGEEFVHLELQFKKLNASPIKIGLQLSPNVETAIGKIKLPKFAKDMGIAEYVSSVEVAINNQIKEVAEQYKERGLFVSAVVNSFSSSIIEYDASKFYKVCFVFEECEDFDCLVTVQLGGRFPHDRPRVQVQSLCCQIDKSCSTPVLFHSFNPHVSGDENMASLREILQDGIKVFQKHRHH